MYGTFFIADIKNQLSIWQKKIFIVKFYNIVIFIYYTSQY